jgi:hypothetical protein
MNSLIEKQDEDILKMSIIFENLNQCWSNKKLKL